MTFDTRKKGCPNEACGKHQSQYKYNAEDNFCTECGSPLVFVCARCFAEIADEGPEHKYCAECEAKQSEAKLLDKAKYAAKGLDYARIEALKKAREASLAAGAKLKETGADMKESMGDNDVVDTIIDVGSKAVMGVGTFAIKRVEKILAGIKKGDEDN